MSTYVCACDLLHFRMHGFVSPARRIPSGDCHKRTPTLKPVLLNRRVLLFFPRTTSLGCRAPEAAFHLGAAPAPPPTLPSAAVTFSVARLEQLGVKCSLAAVSALELPQPIFPGWPEKAWNGFACGGRTRGKVSLTVLLN